MDKKIFVAMGSFKDVFSPSEMTNLLAETFAKYGKKCVGSTPIVDGGEYTHETIMYVRDSEEKILDNVCFCTGERINVPYLDLGNRTAFVSSSSVLRLRPGQDNYKNPLFLTAFGLGEILRKLLNNQYSKIYIGLGGTNTIDFGISVLQGLGAKLYDNQNMLIEGKVLTNQILKLSKIDIEGVKKTLRDKQLVFLCDGNLSMDEMATPNLQKIGEKYIEIKTEILETIQKINFHVKELLDIKLGNMAYTGSAGGVFTSFHILFKENVSAQLGGDFFLDLFEIPEKLKNCDIVITGEGKFDNSLFGKGPICLAKLAQKHGKKVYYVTGDFNIEKSVIYDGPNIADLPQELRDAGLSKVFVCSPLYPSIESSNYQEKVSYWQMKTPYAIDGIVKRILGDV